MIRGHEGTAVIALWYRNCGANACGGNGIALHGKAVYVWICRLKRTDQNTKPARVRRP